MTDRIRVRIKFSKHGAIKYVGHLDIMRFFQKAFRRAEIDIAYTGGFSPHQVMSFASPLGVGSESDGEYLDVELCSLQSTEELIRRLNEQMTEGLQVLSAKALPEKTKSAMASVAAAGYYISFQDAPLPFSEDKSWREAIGAFLSKEHIFVEKQTKKNVVSVDIRPAIYDFRVSSYEERDCLYLLVDASSSGNVKPGMVLNAFFSGLDLPFHDVSYRFTREDIYLNLGTPDMPEFAPLDAAGAEI